MKRTPEDDGFVIGQIYIPLQECGKPLIKDMDTVFNTRYGKCHVVVKDCILIKHEYLSDETDC